MAAALDALCECRPASMQFGAVLDRALSAAPADALPVDPAAWLEATLLEAYLRRVVILHGCALPVTREPGTRPLGSPLARAQVGAGLEQLTTLLPGNAPLAAETARRLLTLLDGTRDRAALSRELGTGDAGVNTSLGLLGEAGFLMTAP